jgi:hypothetical protein
MTENEHYTKAQQIQDLKVMIEADRAHMYRELEDGSYRAADRYLKAILDNEAEINKLIG